MPHGLVRGHLLAALLESPEEGILGVSLDGVIETWSRGAELIYGYSAQEITGQPLSRLVPLHELPGLETLFSEPAVHDSICSSTMERLHKNGSRILLKIKRILVRDERGEVRGVLESACTLNSYGGDATSECALQSIVEQMPGFFWTTDRYLRIRSNWGKGMAAAKINPGALVNRSVFEFLGCADRHRTPIAEHYDALGGISSNFVYAWKNRFLEIRLEPLRAPSGEINGCLALATDVTGRKNGEEQAHYQARHDALTGLANYREFMDRLEQEVSRAERSHHPFTLLLLDLDGLKRINDLQGHSNMRIVPPDQGPGYLCRTYSVARYEQAANGVYIEFRVIALSRSVPKLFGWIVKPVVDQLPADSMRVTLEKTRDAVLESTYESSNRMQTSIVAALKNHRNGVEAKGE